MHGLIAMQQSGSIVVSWRNRTFMCPCQEAVVDEPGGRWGAFLNTTWRSSASTMPTKNNRRNPSRITITILLSVVSKFLH